MLGIFSLKNEVAQGCKYQILSQVKIFPMKIIVKMCIFNWALEIKFETETEKFYSQSACARVKQNTTTHTKAYSIDFKNSLKKW